MKKIIAILLIVSFSLVLLADDIIWKTLPNGMEVAVKENRSNQAVALYAFVKTGSVNEGDYLGAGISHYLEHVVSGGTTKMRTEDEYQQIGRDMGAIVNAYTTYGVTAFHLITDKQYSDLALEVLSEQVQHSVIDSFEVAREKEVILKEIVMRSTPARSQVRQRWQELVFPNSNRKYPVIGYTNLFRTITRDQLEDYYQKRYSPNNMIFVAVGDFQADEMMEKIERKFADFEREQLNPVYLPTQNVRSGSIKYVEEFDVQQPTVFITSILPASRYKDYFKLDAALDILFSKRQAPIRYKLTEELKLVNYIYAYADAGSDNPEGMINIVFEAKNTQDIPQIVEIIDNDLAAFAKKGFKQEQIQNIINRQKAQRLLATPDIDSECNSIGWSILKYGVPDYDEIALENYQKLEVADLEYALQEYLIAQDRVIFSAVPRGEKAIIIAEDEVEIIKTEAEKIYDKKNLTVIHRRNTEKPLIRGVINVGNSTDYETEETAGTLSFMTNLMFQGSKDYDSLWLTEWLEDHAVDIDVTTSAAGTFIEFKCLKADYQQVRDIILDAMNNPAFASTEIDLAKERATAAYERGLSDAGTQHKDFRNATLYAGSRDALSAQQKLDNVLQLQRQDLQDLHQKYFNAQKAIITFFGDLNREEAIEMAQTIAKEIPSDKIKAEKKSLQFVVDSATVFNQYPYEQVNIDINLPAPKIGDDDYYAMKVIHNILSGSRGRIFQSTRGRNNLSYYAYPTYGSSQDYGFFRLTSQTSIDKKDELVQVLLNDLELLKTELVSQSEICGAIEEDKKIMQSYLNDNALPNYMTYMEAMGLGFDNIFQKYDEMEKITPEEIKAVANRWFDEALIMISVPDESVDLLVD
ncbi:MAG: insulinase family protein [Candidatus Cloacimonadales bacterium]